MHVTRLAPSPTGGLHLGNARTFLINWLMARQSNWSIVLRMEDLDSSRTRPGSDQQAIDDLHWLGIDWDDGPIYQSARQPLYDLAIQRLVNEKLAYPCVCTRRDVVLSSSAPHAEDGAAVYPGTCRGRFATIEDATQFVGREPTIRFQVRDGFFTFTDRFSGEHTLHPGARLGDFVIRKPDGTASYQLAVVVDDAACGVTDIVRGDDLLDSVPRQRLLYDALFLRSPKPTYTHLPLVAGSDGQRLAKRHGDRRLASYRAAGVSAERMVAVLARYSGIAKVPDEITAAELIPRFDLARVPRERVVHTADNEFFLTQGKAIGGE